MAKNRVLWILQWAFGIYFVFVGVMHFIVPDGLPGAMAWMYELPDSTHVIVGVAEVLGGLGLILPGLTGIRPELTSLAALGLVLIMVGAVVWHAGRGEVSQIVQNLIIMAAVGYVGYARWRVAPLPSRAAGSHSPA